MFLTHLTTYFPTPNTNQLFFRPIIFHLSYQTEPKYLDDCLLKPLSYLEVFYQLAALEKCPSLSIVGYCIVFIKG